ncbi:MAG: ATP-binding cassette domain-containing protein, partial [Patescibacteria group bacterium]|nr:ATP-binding cassette domain-containing protein [Patescibacteria group bacterium]
MANIIEVKDLTRKFGDFTAVKDVSFSVDEGGIFAFLGPNGAGKSTTIKMLTTLLRPTSGTVHINGHDPVTESDLARHSFGIVFQDPSLDEDLTALENLELHGVLYRVPKDTLAKRIDELLALVELGDRRNDFVRDFSGGMK